MSGLLARVELDVRFQSGDEHQLGSAPLLLEAIAGIAVDRLCLESLDGGAHELHPGVGAVDVVLRPFEPGGAVFLVVEDGVEGVSNDFRLPAAEVREFLGGECGDHLAVDRVELGPLGREPVEVVAVAGNVPIERLAPELVGAADAVEEAGVRHLVDTEAEDTGLLSLNIHLEHLSRLVPDVAAETRGNVVQDLDLRPYAAISGVCAGGHSAAGLRPGVVVGPASDDLVAQPRSVDPGERRSVDGEGLADAESLAHLHGGSALGLGAVLVEREADFLNRLLDLHRFTVPVFVVDAEHPGVVEAGPDLELGEDQSGEATVGQGLERVVNLGTLNQWFGCGTSLGDVDKVPVSDGDLRHDLITGDIELDGLGIHADAVIALAVLGLEGGLGSLDRPFTLPLQDRHGGEAGGGLELNVREAGLAECFVGLGHAAGGADDLLDLAEVASPAAVHAEEVGLAPGGAGPLGRVHAGVLLGGGEAAELGVGTFGDARRLLGLQPS